MNITDYIQLGGTVVTVVLFLQYLIKRDAQFNKMMIKKDEDMMRLSGNHIAHATEAMNKQSNSFDKLSICIDRLIDRLEK